MQWSLKCDLGPGAASPGNMLEMQILLWLVWLSGLSTDSWTKGSPVRFPVRAHAWVAGQVPSRGTWKATTHWCFSPSVSPSLPLSLKVNKWNLFKKNFFKEMQILGPHPISTESKTLGVGPSDLCFSERSRGLWWCSDLKLAHYATQWFLHFCKSFLPLCIEVLEGLWGFDILQSLWANYYHTKGDLFKQHCERITSRD